MKPTINIACNDDISGVIDLQSLNLFANISEADQANGFVTTPFSVAQLAQLIAETGLFVAKENDKIVGYMCAASWEYFSAWEMFRHMVLDLPNLQYKDYQEITTKNSFQYGPVCIDISQRGTDLFPRLFEVMRSSMNRRYPIGLTFINKINARSFKAHTTKIQLDVVDEFDYKGKNYYTLAFLTN